MLIQLKAPVVVHADRGDIELPIGTQVNYSPKDLPDGKRLHRFTWFSGGDVVHHRDEAEKPLWL